MAKSSYSSENGPTQLTTLMNHLLSLSNPVAHLSQMANSLSEASRPGSQLPINLLSSHTSAPLVIRVRDTAEFHKKCFSTLTSLSCLQPSQSHKVLHSPKYKFYHTIISTIFYGFISLCNIWFWCIQLTASNKFFVINEVASSVRFLCWAMMLYNWPSHPSYNKV